MHTIVNHTGTYRTYNKKLDLITKLWKFLSFSIKNLKHACNIPGYKNIESLIKNVRGKCFKYHRWHHGNRVILNKSYCFMKVDQNCDKYKFQIIFTWVRNRVMWQIILKSNITVKWRNNSPFNSVCPKNELQIKVKKRSQVWIWFFH